MAWALVAAAVVGFLVYRMHKGLLWAGIAAVATFLVAKVVI
jgi:expansin (peptidoglycan-binding protein)